MLIQNHVQYMHAIIQELILKQPQNIYAFHVHDLRGVYIYILGRTSLSLALGNMVVARQILLIFNLSYLPCSVQFVNKNYCHAKNDLFTTC